MVWPDLKRSHSCLRKHSGDRSNLNNKWSLNIYYVQGAVPGKHFMFYRGGGQQESMKIFHLLDPVQLNKIGGTRSRTYNTAERCLYELGGLTGPCLHLFALTISALSHQRSKFLPFFYFTESISYVFFFCFFFLERRGIEYQANLVPNLGSWNGWIVNSWNKYAIFGLSWRRM